MIEYLTRNGQFALMIIVWVIAGAVNSTLGIGVVALSVLLLKRKNMYAEMFSGFVLILFLSDSWKPYLAFAKDVKVFYLLLMAVFLLFDSKSFRHKNIFLLPFVPFFIWASFQIMRNPEFMVSVQKTLSYVLLILVVPSYLFKIFYDRGSAFIKDHVMLMSYLLLIGLVMFIIIPAEVTIVGRYQGLMGNPNGIGVFCTVLFMLFHTTTIKFPELFKKNEKLIIYTIIVITIFLSGSRNTILSIGIFLFFLRFYKISPLLGAVIFVLVTIIYTLIVSNLVEILSALGLAEIMRADTLESGSGRVHAWAWALQYINANTQNFFYGNGFGFDEWFFIQSGHILGPKYGHVGGVHNSYLALWLNTGIIGLALWAFGFFSAFSKVIPKTYIALPYLFAILFSATFEAWLMGSLNPYHSTFLFTLALLYTDYDKFADGANKEGQLPVTKFDKTDKPPSE